jgi:hypothetical protein
MSALIRSRGILYGAADVPEIRGFVVDAQPDTFMLAKQGANLFAIEERKGGHRLIPFLQRRGHMEMCEDRCLFIPQDQAR